MKPEQFPFGKEPASRVEQEQPALEVANKVLRVNEAINLPFRLEVGKSASLGVFLVPESFQAAEEDRLRKLKVHKHHWRTGLVARAIFSDREGTLYRDIDAKGIGYLGQEGKAYDAPIKVQSLRTDARSQAGPYGIALEEYALHDWDMSEKFIELGIRTYRVAAIIGLEEIVGPEGKRMSVAAAQKAGILQLEDRPVVELRVYPTKMRVQNFSAKNIEDAIALVGQELGRKDFSRLEYLKWFATTLGEQVGKMHKAGYSHYYFSDTGNVTLDCRIVDLDSVTHDGELSMADSQKRKAHDVIEGAGVAEVLCTNLKIYCMNRDYSDLDGISYLALRALFQEAYYMQMNKKP